jgi:hypothetical protein
MSYASRRFRVQTKRSPPHEQKAFGELASKLSFVTGFEWGRNSSPEKLNHGFTHCFIVTFQTEADRDAYLPHPEHQAFCRKYLDPHMAEVCVVDFRAED